MKFQIDVGDQEKHQVEFTHEKTWGGVQFSVDGAAVPAGATPPLSLNRECVFTLLVGEQEKHEVRVQLVRPWLFAAFRRWTYTVFVDGKAVRTQEG